MKIRSPFLNQAICYVIASSMKLLFRTCRVQVHHDDPTVDPYDDSSPTRYTICIWHDSLLFPVFMRNPPRFVALVGPHRDGSFVTNTLKVLGFDSVRGSSSRDGAKAVLQIIEKSRGIHLGMTPDGPRGPRRKMKPGCAYISSQTGKPVLATAYRCSRAWRFQGRWTDLVVPKPFSRIEVFVSRPIEVPAGASRSTIDAYTETIQQEMDRLHAIADGEHERDTTSLNATPQQQRAA